MIPEWQTEYLINSSSEKNLEITQVHELNMRMQLMLKWTMWMLYMKIQITAQLGRKVVHSILSITGVWTPILKLNPVLGVAGKKDMTDTIPVQRKQHEWLPV